VAAFSVVLHSNMLLPSRLKARGLLIPKGRDSKSDGDAFCWEPVACIPCRVIGILGIGFLPIVLREPFVTAPLAAAEEEGEVVFLAFDVRPLPPVIVRDTTREEQFFTACSAAARGRSGTSGQSVLRESAPPP
jgi:hypothetical protein